MKFILIMKMYYKLLRSKNICKYFFKPSGEKKTNGEYQRRFSLGKLYLVFLVIVYSIILCILCLFSSRNKNHPINFFSTCLKFQNHFSPKHIVSVYVYCMKYCIEQSTACRISFFIRNDVKTCQLVNAI